MKAVVKTLSPVHIGNGTTYNKNIDFIQVRNKIGVIDENKVLNFIGKANIHQWVAAINKGGNAFLDLIKQRGWNDSKLEDICTRINNLITINNNSSQLKEIYRSPMKGISIPGSSVKGSMRTTLFYNLLDQELLKSITISEIGKYDEKGDKYKWSDTKLLKRIFGNNPNEDVGRFLKIGDIHFENVVADVFELQILNLQNGGWGFKRNQQALVEAIPQNSVSEFQMSIDTTLLKENVKNAFHNNENIWDKKKIAHLEQGITGLCKIANTFTKQMIKEEHQAFKDEGLSSAGKTMLKKLAIIYNDEIKKCGENEMVIRIGANSGYTFMTGKWVDYEDVVAIHENNSTNYNLLRKSVQRNRDYSNMNLWPKTRKIASDGSVFGFVKITFG